MKKNEIIFLVPARAGSKGIRGKNSRPFCGKPLICHTIDSIAGSYDKANIIVSTNCSFIQEICMTKYLNLVTLHRRSEAASGDNSPIQNTIKEISYLFESGKNRKSLCLLQPTSPLRTSNDIKEAIQIHCKNNHRNLVSVTKVKHSSIPEKILVKEGNYTATKYDNKNKSIHRQDMNTGYVARNGAIYIASLSKIHLGLIANESLIYEMPVWRSIDIDNMEEWNMAELMMSNLAKFESTKS